jgi:hypothetical protein
MVESLKLFTSQHLDLATSLEIRTLHLRACTAISDETKRHHKVTNKDEKPEILSAI